jgi:hypothetical protein
VQRHLRSLERAVARRVSATDIKRFIKVLTALEQEAHDRVGSKRARPNRKRTKALL